MREVVGGEHPEHHAPIRTMARDGATSTATSRRDREPVTIRLDPGVRIRGRWRGGDIGPGELDFWEINEGGE